MTGAAGGPARGVDVLGVLVPARDEEELLPACLAALAVAAAAPGLAGVTVEVVVVADGCCDGTVDRAAEAGATVLSRSAPGGNVGAARDLGARHLLGQAARGRVPADRVWLASTDADSRVPENWLVLHRTAAEAGVQALLGTVAVADWSGHPPGGAAEFARTYDAWRAGGVDAVHPHVHGANLGVRGSAYLDVGGFPPVGEDEDRALVTALVRSGAGVLRTPASPVLTSSRRVARARAGFGRDMRLLAVRPAAVAR
ncbi:glycosyltransferase family 2 protein [Modestobacter sp. DSM 44400]|uniref:glycosyltransferase n=1 Tax=Modestobacter sp. DSM 44400 TaxID=1550230 RepID=UPI000B859D50|nr:glycosyltransferase [Modestobacter sp. DSM 44400]